MGLAFAIITLSPKHSFNLNKAADKAVHALNPLLHELLIAEVFLSLFLGSAVKGVLYQDKFTSGSFQRHKGISLFVGHHHLWFLPKGDVMDVLALLQPTGCSQPYNLLVLVWRIAHGDAWIAPFMLYVLFHWQMVLSVSYNWLGQPNASLRVLQEVKLSGKERSGLSDIDTSCLENTKIQAPFGDVPKPWVVIRHRLVSLRLRRWR